MNANKFTLNISARLRGLTVPQTSSSETVEAAVFNYNFNICQL